MKKFSKILCLALSLLAVLSCFCGCESKEEKIAKLSYTWVAKADHSKKQAKKLLENISLQDEELKLCDTSNLKYAKRLELTKKGSYTFSYDVAATKECVSDFYKENFKLLYKNRESLSELYKTDFKNMSEEDFYSHYAFIYGKQSYDEMISYFAEIAYKYDEFDVIEEGKYEVKGKRILFTEKGKKDAGAVEYEFDKKVLKLKYANGTEKYNKEK